MPTGYTARIKNGITFKEFALHCACSRFYDCSELPDKFIVSDYYSKEIVELTKELNHLNSMTDDELEIASQKECEFENRERVELRNEKIDLKNKYNDMLNEVEKWIPPSKEHRYFKKYMIEQIKSSIDCDCGWLDTLEEVSFYRVAGKEWYKLKKSQLLEKIS
jgi:hypothetical protein